MIKDFIERFDAERHTLASKFAAKHPDDYKDVVRMVVETISTDNLFNNPDPKKITEIDHGNYQGTLVYVIAEKGYQPSTFWYVKVYYGSCSVCDTLQSIRMDDYSGGLYPPDPVPTQSQVKDYMTLALHIVQGIKVMGDSD